MGIEMRLHLIDEESLNFLLNLHWNEMYVQLEKGLLRGKRPPGARRRPFSSCVGRLHIQLIETWVPQRRCEFLL